MKTQSKHLELPLLETLYPTLECTVLGSGEALKKKQIPVRALIDTGFDDFFSIPKSLASELGITELSETEVQLGNGDQVTVDVGQCELIFPFSSEILVMNAIIDEDDECLIGMSLLSEICSSFEINFKEELIKFYGLNI